MISAAAGRATSATNCYVASALSTLATLPRDLAPRLAGTLTGYDGLMLEAMGLTVPVGTVCRVATARGETIAAEVVGFREDRLLLMSYADATDLKPWRARHPLGGRRARTRRRGADRPRHRRRRSAA